MSDDNQDEAGDALSQWSRDTFDKAVHQIIDLGIIDGAFVEARPSWTLPNIVVIGQVREANDSATFTWIICGDLPTDHLGSAAAATPRDAARRFSLKWQLDATRTKDSAVADTLIAKAEELYEIVEDDSLWQ